jgi:hypothetical protein
MVVSSYSFTLNTYFGAHVTSCTLVNYMLVFIKKILNYLEEPKRGEDTRGREAKLRHAEVSFKIFNFYIV